MESLGLGLALAQSERHLLELGEGDPGGGAQILAFERARDTAIGDPVGATVPATFFDGGEMAAIPAVEGKGGHTREPLVPRAALAVHRCRDGSLVGLFTDLVACNTCIPGHASYG